MRSGHACRRRRSCQAGGRDVAAVTRANQFKPLFEGSTLGHDHPLHGLRRATNSQKCMRAGGKHNDLDDVGFDTYHHTFFEMLGNWSFGDYFKEDSIAFAWELLTQVYGLPPERLYATYFQGDETMGIARDDEARELWLQYLPASHILPGDAKDNFWEMGDTGPCGPCSELHFDARGWDMESPVSHGNASHLVNQDDPRVIEIWNLVFMQYFNGGAGKDLFQLPAQHVDTGMGLERLAAIMQHKQSNYDSDLFTGILDRIHQLRPEGCAAYGPAADADEQIAYRVLADHCRALTFSIADRIQPGNTGRGYVLRRLLRRGIMFGSKSLGLGNDGNFFSGMAPIVADLYAEAYPELGDSQTVSRIIDTLAAEEELFADSWRSGERAFDAMVQNGREKMGENVIPGMLRRGYTKSKAFLWILFASWQRGKGFLSTRLASRLRKLRMLKHQEFCPRVIPQWKSRTSCHR